MLCAADALPCLILLPCAPDSLLPCPKYVVDARVGEQGKNVQGVFSACPSVTRVVTVIDKDTNHPCPPC